MKHGITPACAGKRPGFPGFLLSYRDHPRVCGEKHRKEGAQNDAQGSPPRVRGKVCAGSWLLLLLRITPACAGKSKVFCCSCYVS